MCCFIGVSVGSLLENHPGRCRVSSIWAIAVFMSRVRWIDAESSRGILNVLLIMEATAHYSHQGNALEVSEGRSGVCASRLKEEEETALPHSAFLHHLLEATLWLPR